MGDGVSRPKRKLHYVIHYSHSEKFNDHFAPAKQFTFSKALNLAQKLAANGCHVVLFRKHSYYPYPNNFMKMWSFRPGEKKGVKV